MLSKDDNRKSIAAFFLATSRADRIDQIAMIAPVMPVIKMAAGVTNCQAQNEQSIVTN